MSRPTFNSLAEADAYFTGNAAWMALDDAAQQAALEQGAQYLTLNYVYKGWITDTNQVLPFPRVGLTDREGRIVSGIPQQVKDAELILALASTTTQLFKNDTTGGIKSESSSVGPISKSVTYAGEKSTQTRFTLVDALLRDFLLSGSSTAGQVTVDRA